MANTRAYPDYFDPGPSSSSDLNQLPWGCVAQGERSADLTGIDSVDGETMISLDITVPDGRRQDFYAGVTIRSDIAGGVHARIEIDGVQIQRRNEAALGAGKDVSFEVTKGKELAAGTYNVKLIVGRSGVGSNLVSGKADGETGVFGTMFLYIYDVGPAFATGS